MLCCGAKHKGEAWVLQPRKKAARVANGLSRFRHTASGSGAGPAERIRDRCAGIVPFDRDEYGEVRAVFSRQEAIDSFVLPALPRGLRTNCVLVGGEIWRFDVEKPYMDRSFIAASPAAVQAVQFHALHNLLLGGGALLLGLAVTLGSLIMAHQNEGGGAYVVTAGLIMVCNGTYGFVEHGWLQGIARGREERT